MHGHAIRPFPDTPPVLDVPHPHAPHRVTCALPSPMAPAAATGGHFRCPLRARLGALRKRRQPHATRLRSSVISSNSQASIDRLAGTRHNHKITATEILGEFEVRSGQKWDSISSTQRKMTRGGLGTR